MADPLSVLGAAVGITPLIIQITDECIKGCRNFGNVMHMLKFSRLQTLRRSSSDARKLSLFACAPGDRAATLSKLRTRIWYTVRGWCDLRRPPDQSILASGGTRWNRDGTRDLRNSEWQIRRINAPRDCRLGWLQRTTAGPDGSTVSATSA